MTDRTQDEALIARLRHGPIGRAKIKEAADRLEARIAKNEALAAAIFALNLALPILEDERFVLFESKKMMTGKHKGQVIHKDARADLERMDAAIAAVVAALNQPEQET